MSESYARYKLRKDGLPHPCMSILEQLDFKHEFLQDRLASIPLPHTGALYMDSEVIDIKLGHEASNTYEWSAARFVDGKPVSLYFHSSQQSYLVLTISFF